ncbi:MAG: hypothetical protein AAF799_32975 [Myxococcota bacterium]
MRVLGLASFGCSLVVGACTTPAEIGNSRVSGTATTGEGTTAGTGMGSSTGADEDSGLLPGCQQYDMLFVIDDSEGMAAAHHRLIDTAPDFIRRLRNMTGVSPVNLMVVDTSGGEPPASLPVHECQGADCCVAMCEQGAIKPYPYCSEDGGAMRTCAEWRLEVEFGECDRSLGAGRTYNGGEFRDCNGLEGNRYAVSEDSPLAGPFGCLGNVGDGGNPDERIADAMTRALQMSQAGDCNEGFVRDDAVLLVAIFTNAAMTGSPADLEAWREALAAAKGGDESKIVVLGIFGDGDLPQPVCEADEAVNAPRLRQFVDSYGDRGVACSVCSLDYSDCLDEAGAAMTAACEAFETP